VRSLVYVVAKAPRAGEAKTRLCPPLRPVEAAQLAGAFLRDTVGVALQSGVDVRLICRHAGEQAALRPLTGPIPVYAQQGAGLGAALESAFAQGLADGYARIGVLSADTPTLPPETISRAFAILDRADVVLGPSDDGGYYLLAAKQLYPALFQNMIWSTSDVARETLRRCATLNLRTRVVDTWPDVDDVAALCRLVADLRQAPPDVAPRTRAALADLAAVVCERQTPVQEAAP
jgi:hypothetical protein